MSVASMVTHLKVDRQGRVVLPQWLRRELGADPGEVVVRRTPDGFLLTPAAPVADVRTGDDGLPLLHIGRAVTNDEVLAAIDAERSDR